MSSPRPIECHPDCTLGSADHPGSREYRCIDANGMSLPFPGEPWPPDPQAPKPLTFDEIVDGIEVVDPPRIRTVSHIPIPREALGPVEPSALDVWRHDHEQPIATPDAPEPSTIVQTFGWSVPMSRTMAVAMGLVEPTDEERAAMDAAAADWEATRRTAWEQYDTARGALDQVIDPVARVVLAHHGPHEGEHVVTCHGCDVAGLDAEPPEWPCSTVVAVAEHYGVPLPDSLALSGGRPEPTRP